MALPVLNFTTSIDRSTDIPKLVLQNTSTDGDELTITSKEFITTDVNGVITSYIIPPNNIVIIPVPKDIAIRVDLVYRYIEVTSKTLEKSLNVLVAVQLSTGLYKLRVELLNQLIDRGECKGVDKKLHELLEMVDMMYKTALVTISTDLLSTQKALNFGNSLLLERDC